MLNIETLSVGSVTQQVNGRLVVDTKGQGFTEITEAVSRWVFGTGILHGLLTALDRLAPRDVGYVHATEGHDDMPAHIRTMLSGVSLSIPVVDGQMVLGTWQGVYLAEHRDRPHARDLIVHLIGA